MRAYARKTAFQLIFQADQGNEDDGRSLAFLSVENRLTERDVRYVEEMLDLYRRNCSRVDAVIAAVLKKGWTLDRLGSAERSILRLGALELLYRDDIPPGVTIDEAVRLAKLFGDENAPSLVNGILDRLHRT